MELRKVDASNLHEVINLSVTDSQKDFLETNTESILEAYVTITSNGVMIPFGIYENNELIGFIMIAYGATGDKDEPSIAAGNYCICEFMIDKKFQSHGYGRKALETALDYILTKPYGDAEYCWLSYEPENTIACHLYQTLGFEENGQTYGKEIVMARKM